MVFTLPCTALVLFLLSLLYSLSSQPLSLLGYCLPARRVAEGAGEVIQSRISPSHPPSWYSYHAIAPGGCLPEYRLTEGDFPLSFQLSLSPACFSAPASPCSLHPRLLRFLPVSCSFFFMLAFFFSHPSVSPPSVFFSGLSDSACISNHVRAEAVICCGC